MKTLVLSLLRLGDIISATPVLEGLRRKGDEVHLLIHDSFKSIQPLLHKDIQVHLFPRQLFMRDFGDASVGSFSSMDRIVSRLTSLNSEQFDRVVNLTHTKLSGHICGAIDCKTKIGLELKDTEQASVHGDWFQFLEARNHRYSTLFHHIDIFKKSVGISDLGVGYFLFGSNRLSDPIEQVLAKSHQKITLVQVSSNEEKKNLPLSTWLSVFQTLYRLRPNGRILILAAPNEFEAINSWVYGELISRGLPVECIAATLEDVLNLCRVADLLITLDTSIKHLAASTQIPIIELAIGSANFRELGVYRGQAWIIAPRTSCYPCAHYGACSQARHLCAEALPAELISVLAHKVLQRSYYEIKVLAEEYKDVAEIYETIEVPDSGWYVLPVSRELDFQILFWLLERESWEYSLENRERLDVADYGSRALRLERILRIFFAGSIKGIAPSALNNIELNLEFRGTRIAKLRQMFRRALGENGVLADMRDEVHRLLRAEAVKMLSDDPADDYRITVDRLLKFRESNDFVYLRKVNTEIDGLYDRVDSQKKILRTLRERMASNEYGSASTLGKCDR